MTTPTPPRPTTRPTWLPQTPTRTATLTICPTCKHPTITGLDDDRCAITAHTDPTPLDPIGELLALTTGRTTYDLTRQAGHYQLDPRHVDHIRSNDRRHTVLAEHRCDALPLPAATPTQPHLEPAPLPDQPPF